MMYEVEKIVCSRINKKGRKEFLIKWVGYDSSQNTWEPEKNLTNVQELLDDFLAKERSASKQKKTGESDVVAYQSFSQNQQQEKSQSEVVNKSPRQIPPKVEKDKPKQKSLFSNKKIKILGMCDYDEEGLVYQIEVDNKKQWVSRGYFIPDHVMELLKFYESHIVFHSRSS